jgi:hypothetical protein
MQRTRRCLKLIIFLVFFAVIIYAGYLYIPASVDAYYYQTSCRTW